MKSFGSRENNSFSSQFDNIQLLHLNEINMRFNGAEYNNIEQGENYRPVVKSYANDPIKLY